MDNSHMEIFAYSEDFSKLIVTESQSLILTTQGQVKSNPKFNLPEPASNFAAFKDLLVLILPSGLYTLSLQEPVLQLLLKGSFTSCSVSSSHLGAIKSDGLLYVFGNLKHLSLRTSTPVALRANNLFVPRQIACGRQFTVISTCGGSVYIYNSNNIKPSRLTDLNAFFINFLASSEEFFVCLSDSGVVHAYDSSGSPLELSISNDFWVVSVACSANTVVVNSDSNVLACFLYEKGKNALIKISELGVGKVKVFSGFKVAVWGGRTEDHKEMPKEEEPDKFQFSAEGFNTKYDPGKVEIIVDTLKTIFEKNKKNKWALAMEALKANDNYLLYYIYCFNTFILTTTKIGFRLKFESLETIRSLYTSSKLCEILDSIYKSAIKKYFLRIQFEYLRGCLKELNKNLWVLSEKFKNENKKWAFEMIFVYQPRPKKNSISYDKLLLNLKLKKAKEISILKNSMISPKFPKKSKVFSVKSINNSPTYNNSSCATERRLEYSLKLTKKLQEKSEKKLGYDFKLERNIFAYSKAGLSLCSIFQGVLKRVFFSIFFEVRKGKQKFIVRKNLQVSPKNSLFP